MAFVTNTGSKEKESKAEVKEKFKTKLKNQLKDADEDEVKKVPRQKQKAVAMAAVRSGLTTSAESGKSESTSSDDDAVVTSPSAKKPEVVKNIDGAADALRKDGIITVKKIMFNRAFTTTYNLTLADLDAVQDKLTKLREAQPSVKKTNAAADLSKNENRPTTGGMSEDQAAQIAKLNEWDVVTQDFICSDISHSPKGRLYTNGQGAYYGADNSGHVGWGFKMWTKKDKSTLDYQGNLVWDGDKWKVIARSGAGKKFTKT